MSIAHAVRAFTLAATLLAASTASATSFDQEEYTRAAALVQTLPTSPALKPDQRLQLLASATTLTHWAAEAPLTPADRSLAWALAARAAVGLGDQPRAIICFRRALLADPLNASARTGLLQLRARLDSPPPAASSAQPTDTSATPGKVTPQPEFSPTPIETVRSLLARLPSGLMPVLAFGFLFIASLAAALSIALRVRPRWLFPTGALAALLSLLTGAAAVVSSWPSLTTHEAVVIATGLQPASAPGYSAAPSSAPPPVPGVELRVLDTASIRSEAWVQVFAINQPLSPPYWIPADAIEPIIPSVRRPPG